MNATYIKNLTLSALGCAMAVGTSAWAGPIGVTVDFSCADGQGVKTAGGNVCTGGTGPNTAQAIKSWTEGFTGSAGPGSVNIATSGPKSTFYNPQQGDPKAGISTAGAGIYTLTVTDSGDYLFSFTGIDLGSVKNAVDYTITGYDGATKEFTETGKICGTVGSCTGSAVNYFWVTGNSDLLTDLTISVNDASTTYEDNLEVDAVAAPEPGSLFLLGTGLLGLAFVAFRKSRTNRLSLNS